MNVYCAELRLQCSCRISIQLESFRNLPWLRLIIRTRRGACDTRPANSKSVLHFQ